MLRDLPGHGEAAVAPVLDAAAHGPRVVAGAAERLGGERRAGAEPAVEDDRPVARQRLRLRREPLELDVAGAADVPPLALLRQNGRATGRERGQSLAARAFCKKKRTASSP